MLEQLIHHGVIVPDRPASPGMSILLRGERRDLTPDQEEMAMAWAAKKDTEYVKDPVFVENFMRDFSRVLGIDPPLALHEVDFAAYNALVDENRRKREALSPEDRKAAAAERKAERERLKAHYGYAIVNGQRVELGTYMVEPSGIFMGRGKHPLRGRWKQGARQEDITLNYGPNPAEMEGNWEEVLWQPSSMWVARWKDKLTGKLKYIWLSDTAPIKQSREASKFDQALKLDKHLPRVRQGIRERLESEDPLKRMVATACYLIDELCLRVGDEKEADEADTVGATTLRPEHITLHDDCSVEFEFLGKDSVRWHKTLVVPELVYDSLADLVEHARPSRTADGEPDNVARQLPQIFPDISSSHVNAFFSSILPGLSAKKFRTYHATKVVEQSLADARVKRKDPEHVKWQAANLANLEAAMLCNHTKQVTGNWETTQERYVQRIAAAQKRVDTYAAQVRANRKRLTDLQAEAREREAGASGEERARVRARYGKRVQVAQRNVDQARARQARAKEAVGKIKAQLDVARRKREWNLSTSLKSYVDPRVYQRWGERVDYDVLNSFFPTALRRKYAWVQYAVEQDQAAEKVEIRPCLPSDLAAVARLLQQVTGEQYTREELQARYLPGLAEEWREALIALGSEQQVVAFAALGPVYSDADAAYVDCFAVVHPDYQDDGIVESLAAEMTRRFDRHVLLHPPKRGEPAYQLRPTSMDWCALMPDMAVLLGFGEAERAE